MRPTLGTLLLTLGFLISLPMAAASEHVILLHGLMRSKAAMAPMAEALTRAGYTVHNIDYPSRTAPIAQLADDAIGPALAECHVQGAEKIHFVTHSLGGILVRSYFSRHAPDAALGRVVMLGPPNQGSEVVDRLRDWWLFKKINGPAGQELGTDAASTPNRLGPANFIVGIIAGRRSINWINSFVMIPGSDDGKVSIERTKLAGMADHFVVSTAHPFMAMNRTVITQTLAFLHAGAFTRSATVSG